MRQRNESGKLSVEIFNSPLGWVGIVGSGSVLRRLRFGDESPDALMQTIRKSEPEAELRRWWPELAARLQAYAEGAVEDFSDVEVEYPAVSEFRQRVRGECRRIPYGATKTYGELAVASGAERAGRAVGSVMKANRTPLIVPCHRVVRSGNLAGNYTGGGANAKLRLLALERRGSAVVQS